MNIAVKVINMTKSIPNPDSEVHIIFICTDIWNVRCLYHSPKD